MGNHALRAMGSGRARLSAAFDKLRGSKTATGTSLTLVFVAIGSVLTLVMYSLAARHLGPQQFGLFSTWFNGASFLTAVSLFGQELLISRTWNEYLGSKDDARARGALVFGYVVTICGGTLIGMLLYAGAVFWGADTHTAFAAALFLATQALFHFTTYASQAIVGIVAGEGQGQIAWRTFVLIALGLAIGLHLDMDAAGLLELIAVSQLAVALLQTVWMWRHISARVSPVKPIVNWREWAGRARHMTFAGIIEAATQNLDVILVSILVDPTAAGAYFVASRIANIFFRIGIATTSYASRSVPPLVYTERYGEIQGVLRSIAAVGGLVIGAGLIGLLVAGKLILSMFGSLYVNEYWTLIVLALGPSLTVLFGPARTVLLSMGHERIYARIVGSGLIARLVLTVVLTLWLGTLGTALAWTLASAGVGLALNIACRRLEGLDPSVSGLVRRITPRRAEEAEAKARADAAGAGVLDHTATAGLSAHDGAPVPPPRLLMFQPHAQNSGTQAIAQLLEEELTKRGIDVEQVFLYRKSPNVEVPAHWRICAEEKSRNPLKILRTGRALTSQIKRARPDIVMCYEHYGSIIGALAMLVTRRVPILSNLSISNRIVPRWITAIDSFLGRIGLYDRVIANSAALMAEMQSYPDAYRQRVVRIDNAFQPKTSTLDKAAARASFGLPAGAILLGSVARLHPSKNLSSAVRLLASEPAWHLAIGGDGEDKDQLVALARKLGCQDRLHLVGELKPAQVGDMIAALDVFVFPSQSETFGLAPLEAAHAGVPVVANDLPVLRDVLDVDGTPCAVLTNTESPLAFERAVRSVLDDPVLARQLAARGRALAQKYAPGRMADALRRPDRGKIGRGPPRKGCAVAAGPDRGCDSRAGGDPALTTSQARDRLGWHISCSFESWRAGDDQQRRAAVINRNPCAVAWGGSRPATRGVHRWISRTARAGVHSPRALAS